MPSGSVLSTPHSSAETCTKIAVKHSHATTPSAAMSRCSWREPASGAGIRVNPMPCNGNPSTRLTCSTTIVALSPATASATYATPCTVTSTVAPAASQRYAATWRGSVSRRARSSSAISSAMPLATSTTPVTAWVRSEVTDRTTSENTTTRPRTETKPRDGSSVSVTRRTCTSERTAAATTPPPSPARSPRDGSGNSNNDESAPPRGALRADAHDVADESAHVVSRASRTARSPVGSRDPGHGDTPGSRRASGAIARRTGGRAADPPAPSAYDGSGHRA